jgi:predicted butyrate kinase (DUF1464 family)
MLRVAGIDPGTVSFDLCVLEDGLTVLERSVPSADVARRPELLLDLLRGAQPLDLIAGPSGYGLPLVPVHAVGERELRLLCLAMAGEGAGIGGLRTLVRLLREAQLPVIFTPGVVQLPTLPPHRKVNRIDLGTADKVCAAAFAIHEQTQRLGLACHEASFVMVELGGAFTAVLTVDEGRVVSGQGGSSGPLGYLAAGALDAEVASLLRTLGKRTVFSGGVAFVAGHPELPPELLATREDEPARRARQALVEGVVKAVAGELALLPRAREILLSGRLARIPGFRQPLTAALSALGPVRHCGASGVAKEAAVGAALIADGLAGGRFAALVDALRLRESAGSVLDHLFLEGAEALREWALRAS